MSKFRKIAISKIHGPGFLPIIGRNMMAEYKNLKSCVHYKETSMYTFERIEEDEADSVDIHTHIVSLNMDFGAEFKRYYPYSSTRDGIKFSDEDFAPVFGDDREDLDFISVIEYLNEHFKKDLSMKYYTSFKIVEIPCDVDWEIKDYDGIESVVEKHREWH